MEDGKSTGPGGGALGPEWVLDLSVDVVVALPEEFPWVGLRPLS